MNMPFLQAGRLGRLNTVLGPDQLVMLRFFGSDFMNALFEYEVEALATTSGIDFDALLGTHATVTIDTRHGPRHFDGMIARTRYAGAGENGHRFILTLRPWLWLADQRFNQKIFHSKTVDRIITETLAPYADAGSPTLEIKLERDYPVLEYTVQYRESDFAFVSRLMERFGISYHFVHSDGNHTLLLTDSDASHAEVAGGVRKFLPLDGHHQPDEEHFWDLSPERKMQTGAVSLIDYNFKTPRAEMLAERVAGSKYAFGQLESYEYPGTYPDREEGRKLARTRSDQFQGEDRRNRATGDCISLSAGMVVNVDANGIENVGGARQICLFAQHSFVAEGYGTSGTQSDGYAFSGSYLLMPTSAPLAPPRRTPVPVVQGPQTAMVVGEDEIDCDEFGRILVRFHWDREGAISMRCRVSQQWAGAGLGQVVIPRVGMEVIVDFVDGDPDKPLVTGCVVNASNANIYGLPANKTRSGFKSKTHNGGGNNELMFEDAGGKEEIFLHAEKDMNRVIEDNEDTKINRGNRSITVALGDETKAIQSGKLTETVALSRSTTANTINETAVAGSAGPGHITYHADDNISMTAKKVIALDATQDITQVTQQSHRVQATHDVVSHANKLTQVTAGERITLAVGESTLIEIVDGQITLKCGSTSITLSEGVLDQIGGQIHLNTNKDAG